jgi:hypothetical protein
MILEVSMRVVDENEVRQRGLGTARLHTYTIVTDEREADIE